MILIDKLLYYLITKKSTKQTFIHSFYSKVKIKKKQKHKKLFNGKTVNI